MVRIKGLCLEVLKLDLFFYIGKQSVRVEEYRAQQEHVIHKAVNYIRNTWLVEIINIIRSELRFVDKKSSVLEGDCVDR